jgi:hypothetical protein
MKEESLFLSAGGRMEGASSSSSSCSVLLSANPIRIMTQYIVGQDAQWRSIFFLTHVFFLTTKPWFTFVTFDWRYSAIGRTGFNQGGAPPFRQKKRGTPPPPFRPKPYKVKKSGKKSKIEKNRVMTHDVS